MGVCCSKPLGDGEAGAVVSRLRDPLAAAHLLVASLLQHGQELQEALLGA